MSNADFMLEKLSLSNFSSEELLRKAEDEGNELAAHLYEVAVEETREMVEAACKINEDELPFCIPDNVNYIVYDAEWNKVDEGRFIFGDFNRDINVYNNHVEVEHIGSRRYRVLIEHGSLGEERYETIIGGLKEAKVVAEKAALDFAAKRELGVF